ncbi:MAG: hypothetical protein EPN17_02175 [Methylobacter sp.]|nr:MAG: hypothetical protein EPN17_02175 [Methylobacter sp.]
MINDYIGKFVGVIPPRAFSSLSYPKQLILMFDGLAIDLGQNGLNVEDRQIIQKSMTEIGWMSQSGLLTLLSGLQASNELIPSKKAMEHARQAFGLRQVTHERFNAFLLRKKGIDAVPIMNQFEDMDLDSGTDRDAVIRLTIREFPIPSDLTPWEAIQDFKRDKEAQDKYWSLRKWINKTGKSGLKHYEVTDELRELLNEYDQSMKLHKMKHETGAFEVVVCTTTEILEDLVKFKWSNAVKAVFDIHRQDVNLLEDEKNMPGREVAYIAYAKNRFS